MNTANTSTENGWIDVNDRLPEFTRSLAGNDEFPKMESEEVLVLCKSGSVEHAVALNLDGSISWINDREDRNTVSDSEMPRVVAWAPIK